MFNVSKKTLSLVLCLTLIASVVVFCFAGPASAVTNAYQYPVYDEAVSLAAKPEVKLDFEGNNYYGIPFNRGSTIKFNQNGFATISHSGGWSFVGNNGTCPTYEDGVVITSGTVTNNDKEDAKEAYVVQNYLYELEHGKTYKFVMKYKFLAGSYINPRSIGINVFQNPHKKTSDADKFASFPKAVTFVEGNSVVWETGGVVQEGRADTVTYKDNGVSYTKDVKVLETDTDVQTMTAYITLSDSAITSGTTGNAGDFGPFYLGLQNYYGSYTPNFNATLAIDSIEIYNLTDAGSSFQNPITFDNGGIVSTRAMNPEASYHNDGYAIIPDNDQCAGAAFIGIDNIYNKDIAPNKANIANADTLYHSKMFKFQKGQSYKITFRYRYAAGSYVINGAIPRLKLQMAPNGAAKGYDDLWFKYGIPTAGSFAKDVFVTGLECVTENTNKTTAIEEDTPWQDVTVTFTVRDDIEGFTGAYFGIGVGLSDDDHGMAGVKAERTLHIDDYNVEQLVGYRISSFDSQNVSLDFEKYKPTPSEPKDTNNATYETDKNGNTYMKYSGSGRTSFEETRVLKKDKKYYISFDAKSDDGCQHFNFVMGNKGSDSSSYRIFFNNNDSVKTALKNSGSKFYINGKEVDGYTNFKPSSEWQHFGFVLNLDSTKWEGVRSLLDGDRDVYFTFNDTGWQGLEKGGGVYFLFGATTGTSVCYDNIKISQFDEIPNAVPDEGEIKDNTQVSKRNPSGTGENYISAGLRFKNCLPNDVVAAADEVGFVVIPSTMAVTAPTTWYKLDGTGHTDAKKVVCKNSSMNRCYEKTGFDTYYQLVLTGLSTETGKTAYNRRFSAVMYTKKDGAYTYYALGETSYNQVGAIKDVINAQ